MARLTVRALTLALVVTATLWYIAGNPLVARADSGGTPRVIFGFRWAGDFAYWRFESNPTHTPLTSEAGRARVREAQEPWNTAGTSFRLVESQSYNNLVRAGHFGQGGEYPRYPVNYVAAAEVVLLNAPWESAVVQTGYITFNSSYAWVTEQSQHVPGQNYYVKDVAIHEFGHWGGIVDDPVNAPANSPMVNSFTLKLSLTDWDKRTLGVIYGGNNLLEKWSFEAGDGNIAPWGLKNPGGWAGLVKFGNPLAGGPDKAAFENYRLGYRAIGGYPWASVFQDEAVWVNPWDRYAFVLSARCPSWNVGDCQVVVAIWGLGVNPNENYATTLITVPRALDSEDENRWHRYGIEGSGNWWQGAHSFIRFEVYNYGGHEVEVDAAFGFKNNQ